MFLHMSGLRLSANDSRTSNILRHFCQPKVFIRHIGSMWSNATVNKCQVRKKYLIYFVPKASGEGTSIRISTVFLEINENNFKYKGEGDGRK